MALAPSAPNTAPAAPPPGTMPAQPNVIPPSVQARISRADQLIAEEQARLRGDPDAPPPPQASIPHDMRPTNDMTRGVADPTQVPPTAPPPPVVDPNAPPPDPNAPPPPALPPEAPAARAEPGTPDATWEQAYKSLKGRFDSQFPRLQEQMGAMTAEIRRLVQENNDLRNAVRPPQPLPLNGAAQPNGATPTGLTDEEVDAFGPELVDVIRRAARAEAQVLVSQGLGTVTQQVNQMGADADAQKLQGMIDYMVSYIPNFVELNSSPDLLAWLSLPDPISGANRQQLLTQAWERREPSRVLAIFSSYLAQSDASQRPAGNQPPPVAPAPPQAPSNRIPLVSLAAPGRAATAAPTIGGPAGQQATYTKAQIAQFYATANRGGFRGKQQEKDAIEADIFRAQLEGRVID